jgi:hypothetical protein
VVWPLKAGSARVHAALDDLRESRPLDVEVIAAPAGGARVRALPSRLLVRVRETVTLDRVVLDPGPGLDPLEVPYTLSIADPKIAEVRAGDQVRGLSPGTTTVELTAASPDGQKGALKTTVPIEVRPSEPAPGAAVELRLTGPGRTTAGATVAFDVALVGEDASIRSVGQAGARLSAIEGEGLIDLQPGAIGRARSPGTAWIQARYHDLVSNTLRLDIQAPAPSFRKIELEVARRPLGVGESRVYRVWGEPSDGGAPQDLTSHVGGDGDVVVSLDTVEPAGDKGVASHLPPRVVGIKVGKIQLRASLRDGIGSEAVSLEIIEFPSGSLAIEPAETTIGMGETTPPLVAVLHLAGDQLRREVEAKWESLEPETLDPDGQHGRFLARAVGRGRVKATFGGLSAFAEVTVVHNPFVAVRTTGVTTEGESFVLGIEVQSPKTKQPYEYRVVADGGEATPWTSAVVAGGSLTARLQSPKLKLLSGGAYHLVIEARDPATLAINRYPYQFRLGLNVIDETRPDR